MKLTEIKAIVGSLNDQRTVYDLLVRLSSHHTLRLAIHVPGQVYEGFVLELVSDRIVAFEYQPDKVVFLAIGNIHGVEVLGRAEEVKP